MSELAISSFNDFTKQQDVNLILIKPQKFNKYLCLLKSEHHEIIKHYLLQIPYCLSYF